LLDLLPTNDELHIRSLRVVWWMGPGIGVNQDREDDVKVRGARFEVRAGCEGRGTTSGLPHPSVLRLRSGQATTAHGGAPEQILSEGRSLSGNGPADRRIRI